MPPRPMYDLMGKDAVLFHHTISDDDASIGLDPHRQQRLNPHPRLIRQLTLTNHNQAAAGRPAQRRTR
jgi:hypothetical protein